MNKAHKYALNFLCITVLILFGAPKISLRLGPLPIYLIDLLILSTAWFSLKLPKTNVKVAQRGTIIFILTMIVLNELINGIIYSVVLDSIYLSYRMTLAGSLFFILPRVLKTPGQLLKVLKFGLVGSFITAGLLIFSSLPMTRGLSNVLLSNSFLTPNAENLSINLLQADSVGIRGTSLVGVSILSGAFLNVIWPLLFLLHFFSNIQGAQRILLYLTLLFTPVGIIMTYSRGALLALLLVLLGMMFFQRGRIRGAVILLGVIVYTGFSAVGFNSELFFFDRIVNRTSAVFEAPLDDERESERFNAYREPFEHVAQNLGYVFFGEGFARVRNGMTSEVSEGINRSDHAVFAKAYYAYGLISSLCLLLLFFGSALTMLRSILKVSKKYSFSFYYVRIVFVLLMGFSSWFSFGHAAVSTPRGAMLMFFVFGLVACHNNFYLFERLSKQLK